MKNKKNFYIDGKWVTAISKEEIKVINPATEEDCAVISLGNKEDVDLARCETVGISSICAGIAGLVTAQKTINTVLNLKDENNILTLINTTDLNINNIILKNNANCVLNNS